MYRIDNDKLECYDLGDDVRKFLLVLWADSKDYDAERIIDNLTAWSKSRSLKAVWILHDRDVQDDGKTLKKAHYHVVVSLENHSTARSVRKHLGLPEKVPLVVCDNFEHSILYFLHMESK